MGIIWASRFVHYSKFRQGWRGYNFFEYFGPNRANVSGFTNSPHTIKFGMILVSPTRNFKKSEELLVFGTNLRPYEL